VTAQSNWHLTFISGQLQCVMDTITLSQLHRLKPSFLRTVLTECLQIPAVILL